MHIFHYLDLRDDLTDLLETLYSNNLKPIGDTNVPKNHQIQNGLLTAILVAG